MGDVTNFLFGKPKDAPRVQVAAPPPAVEDASVRQAEAAARKKILRSKGRDANIFAGSEGQKSVLG